MSKIRQIWNTLEKNCQTVAELEGLIEEGEAFTLTPGQEKVLEYLEGELRRGKRRLLLKAPTGSGKTEVLLRLGVWRAIATSRPILIIAPTRDLCRQHQEYFAKRLRGTPLERVALIHGGLAPHKREEAVRGALDGTITFIIASAMIIRNRNYAPLWDALSLLVVDDVNAFDEDEHLRHLRRFPGSILYMSATPEAVQRFLQGDGAWENMAEMTDMPFDTIPTEVHTLEVGNYHPLMQINLAIDRIREHVARGDRIYIISRFKREVPRIADYLRSSVEAPVFFLHGDMADSKEHQKRHRRKPGGIKATEHRITMMNDFRSSCPAVMVATNLVGSGIDIPMADFIVITDSQSFSPAEKEQLIGRVGRRSRESEALLMEGDSPAKEREIKSKIAFSTRSVGDGKIRYSFALRSSRKGRR
jgi:transcription-repair coupling factor (superfamily II helicase)